MRPVAGIIARGRVGIQGPIERVADACVPDVAWWHPASMMSGVHRDGASYGHPPPQPALSKNIREHRHSRTLDTPPAGSVHPSMK